MVARIRAWMRRLVHKMSLLHACMEDNEKLRAENAQLKKFLVDIENKQNLLEAEVGRLKDVSLTDELTGIFARRYLNEVPSLFAAQERSGDAKTVAVLLIDLDFFKEVNDECSHQAGDAVLVYAAARLQETARTSDIVIRYGGDEFLIIATHVAGKDGVKIFADRLCAAIRSIRIPDCHVSVSASIGGCVIPRNEQGKLRYTVQEAIAIADEAMYASKNCGRDQATVVSSMEEIIVTSDLKN